MTITEEIELKPCPFCGSDAMIERKGDRRQSTICRCTACACYLETGEDRDHGCRWNQRAALSVSTEREEASAGEERAWLAFCNSRRARFGLEPLTDASKLNNPERDDLRAAIASLKEKQTT